MYEEILEQLKKLKAIEPDRSFAKRSKGLILAVQPTPSFSLKYWFFRPNLVWVPVLAVLVIVFIGLSLIPSTSRPVISSSLNPQNLSQEFQELTINIQLEEITYEQNINQAIASALTEISENGTRHLNRSLLEMEKNDISGDESDNPQIDELLDQVIF